MDILGIGGPPIPENEGSNAHHFLLRSSLFIIYLIHFFYAPLGIGGLPIPGAKVMISYPSANDFYHLEVGYVVFVSAARRYDPQGVRGLGTDGQGERGGWSLRRIGRPPIPPLTSHMITELVLANRRY